MIPAFVITGRRQGNEFTKRGLARPLATVLVADGASSYYLGITLMLGTLPETQRAAVTVVAFLGSFFITLAIGRLLKRRAGVRLGLLFRLFCLALAFYVAIWIYGVPHTLIPSWLSFDLPISMRKLLMSLTNSRKAAGRCYGQATYVVLNRSTSRELAGGPPGIQGLNPR